MTGVLGREEGVISSWGDHSGEKVCADRHRGRGDVATSPGRPGVPQELDQARGTLLEPLEGAEPCPHLDHRFLTPDLGAKEFVLKLSSLWPVAAATPGY